MNFTKITSIAFSPCDSTENTAQALALEIINKLNFNSQVCIDHFTKPADRANVREYTENEIAVIASPTFAGKLPNKMLPDFQTKLKGNNTPAVALVTFGNRSFDNSLAELTATLTANGFKVIAAAAIVNEHSFAHVGEGRPNDNDIAQLKDFAAKVAAKINDSDMSEVTVKGDAAAPYYVPKQESGEPAKFLPAKPKTDAEKCKKCGLCAENCPMGSISIENTSEVPGICIKCHSCVNRCPNKAKYFDDEQLLSHIRFLQINHAEYQNNEFFI